MQYIANEKAYLIYNNRLFVPFESRYKSTYFNSSLLPLYSTRYNHYYYINIINKKNKFLIWPSCRVKNAIFCYLRSPSPNISIYTFQQQMGDLFEFLLSFFLVLYSGCKMESRTAGMLSFHSMHGPSVRPVSVFLSGTCTVGTPYPFLRQGNLSHISKTRNINKQKHNFSQKLPGPTLLFF